ncbi:ABC transporter substrate-binding protein [Longimicrobium sp.]|uniref:ABC transporter substrate-binding protein n=1 Tax=Longimicrobium sp. TaxID=2029185 RepID=UPI002E32AFB4|nr:ABC transporter substrate-binding protein [Longimicrobium sp.]
MDRRAFLTAAGRSAVLLAGGWRVGVRDALRIALVTPDADGALARGVTMGVEEAARTGALMGRAAELRTAHSVASAQLFLAEGVGALVGGWDVDSCRALGALAESAGVPFLDTGCAADVLRGAECRRAVFHVEASDAMRAAALAARPADAGEAARAVLWHPTLERFGAAQLNDRFRARWGGAGMDGAAWAGWMAAKALWEASLRARSVEGAALRAYLERETTQFDGHKGWPLSFRPSDRQLRQPLYLVTEDGSRVVAEVPARPAEGGSSRALLDALAGDASASACGESRAGMD